MIFPPVFSSTGGVSHNHQELRLEKSWSKNRPERSEHATGVEPAGDHQWWAIFLTIREKAGFDPGDRFIPFPIKEGIVFKKIKIPNVKFTFEKLSKQTQQKSKSNNTITDDISEAITWARKKI